MTIKVTQEQALALITAYGAEAARWPDEQRAALLALVAADPLVAAAHAEAAQLDRLLGGWAMDVPPRSFDAEALIPVPAKARAPFKVVRWLGAGAAAASVAVALLLGVPGAQTMVPAEGVQIAQNDISSQVLLGSASGQSEPLDGFSLVFTPTADEEDLI